MWICLRTRTTAGGRSRSRSAGRGVPPFGPAEEVALCLELRGACLAANGEHTESGGRAGGGPRAARPGSRNLRALAARQRALAGDNAAGG